VNFAEYISSDPAICHGQACVRGTRIPVSVVLAALAAGMTEAEILDQYPALTIEGIRAAAAYGAMLAGEEVLPLPSLAE
jgi:uncharacterized protein (DUF433 family)